MLKRPFLIFISAISVLVFGLLWYIQSPHFAGLLKEIAARYIPADIGVQASFSELAIQFFPPGLSVKNPKILVQNKKLKGVLPGSKVEAERIDLNFRLFQMFSGDIRVNELNIVNGKIQLGLDKLVDEFPGQKQAVNQPVPPKKGRDTQKPRFNFSWDELFHIRAEAIALENTDIDLSVGQQRGFLHSHVGLLKVAQWSGKGGLGYSVQFGLSEIQSDFLKTFSLPSKIDRLQGDVYLNALGLSAESLYLQVAGIELNAQGKVKGNVLVPKGLSASGLLAIHGDLDSLFRLVPLSPTRPSGSFDLRTNVQVDLDRIQETLKADGVLSLKNAAYQKWKADSVEAEGKWVASADGKEITLSKLIISSQLRNRDLGNQPGDGGRVEIGPVKWAGKWEGRWESAADTSVRVPVAFDSAHIHWLAGGGFDKVYPLDFRLNGKTTAIVNLGSGQDWSVQIGLDNWIDHFRLDNQKYKKVKPLSTLFQVPRIDLKGSALLNRTGIHFTDTQVNMPHTRLRAQGKIDFRTGWDLHATGPIALTDLALLAEKEIRGSGTVGVQVHGSGDDVRVDIDTDLKDAYYLGLFLGGVKGRLIWDDGPSHLIFNRTQVTHGQSTCFVQGKLDFGDQDSADLKISLAPGNIQDYIQIFGNLTRPLGWFPQNLQGSVVGEATIQGGISLNQMKIFADLKGTDWEYWRERFKSVHLLGGYDGGKYFLSNLNLIKRTGSITGKISYDTNRQFDWNFQSKLFSLNEIDHLARLDIPIRGRLELESRGKGVEGSIDSWTHAKLDNFMVRGQGMEPSEITLETDKGVTQAYVTALGDQGLIDFRLSSNPKDLSHFRGEFKQFDFSPVLLIFNPKSIQDKSLAGRISGLLDLKFHSGQMDRANGVVHITDYYLSRQDTHFKMGQPLLFKVQDGNFEGETSFQGELGDVAFKIKSKDTVLDGSLTGNLDTSIVEFFVPSVAQASGLTELDLAMNGTLKEPTFFGKAKLGGGAIRIASLDSPLENVTGTLQLRQNVVTFQKIQADLGGGRVTADGRVVINADRYPSVSVEGKIKNSKLKIYPFQYAKVSGHIGINGEEIPYLIDGTIEIESALSKEKMMNQRQGSGGLKALQYGPPPTRQGEADYPKFKLDIEVEAEKGILIQNDLFRDVQVTGSLNLVNTLEVPRVVGRVEAKQGKLIFKNHAFQIQSAVANFDSPTVLNPAFDLNANTEVNGIKIGLYASGRPDNIKVELQSNPAMQEAEILSLLTVGLTSNDAKKLNAGDLSVVQQGEAASLVLHSLDLNREIEDKTGFHVQLDESLNTQQGTSAFRPLTQTDTAAAPQITIRRKLGDRVSLSAGSTVGAGTNRSNQVNMDFSINKDVSVTGVFNTWGTYSNATEVQPSTQTNRSSFGLDLKFQTRFK